MRFANFNLTRRLLISLCIAVLPATAQEPPDGRRPEPPPGAPRPEGPPGASRPVDRLNMPFAVERAIGGNPFRPRPDDLRELAPGEREELLAFVKEHLPQLYEQIERMDPQRVERELQGPRVARLRHLKRVFEQTPRIGEFLMHHADLMHRIERIAAEHARPPKGEISRQRLVEELRRLVREKAGVEASVLREKIADIDQRRETLIDDLFRSLGDPTADAAPRLAPEDQELRRTWRAWNDAPDGEEKASLRDQLRERCAARIDRARNFLEERAAERADLTDDRVQREVREFIGRAARILRDDRPNPPRRPDRERRQPQDDPGDAPKP